MNQFMIGLVLVIIIIILIVLLGALNKMYPENFFGICKSNNTRYGGCPDNLCKNTNHGSNCIRDLDCTNYCKDCYCSS